MSSFPHICCKPLQNSILRLLFGYGSTARRKAEMSLWWTSESRYCTCITWSNALLLSWTPGNMCNVFYMTITFIGDWKYFFFPARCVSEWGLSTSRGSLRVSKECKRQPLLKYIMVVQLAARWLRVRRSRQVMHISSIFIFISNLFLSLYQSTRTSVTNITQSPSRSLRLIIQWGGDPPPQSDCRLMKTCLQWCKLLGVWTRRGWD